MRVRTQGRPVCCYCAGLSHADRPTGDNDGKSHAKATLCPLCGSEQPREATSDRYQPFIKGKHSLYAAREGGHGSLSACNALINVLSQTLLPDSQQSEDLAQDSMASVAKTPLSSKSCVFYLHQSKRKKKKEQVVRHQRSANVWKGFSPGVCSLAACGMCPQKADVGRRDGQDQASALRSAL